MSLHNILSSLHCKGRVWTMLIILTALSSTCFNNAGIVFVGREYRRNIQWLLVQFFGISLILVKTPEISPINAVAPSMHTSMQFSHDTEFSMKNATNGETILLPLVEDGSGLQNRISSWKEPDNSYCINVINTANPATSIDLSSCNENLVWLIRGTMVLLTCVINPKFGYAQCYSIRVHPKSNLQCFRSLCIQLLSLIVVLKEFQHVVYQKEPVHNSPSTIFLVLSRYVSYLRYIHCAFYYIIRHVKKNLDRSTFWTVMSSDFNAIAYLFREHIVPWE